MTGWDDGIISDSESYNYDTVDLPNFDELEGYEDELTHEQLDMELFSNLKFCIHPTLSSTFHDFVKPLILANLVVKLFLVFNLIVFGSTAKINEHTVLFIASCWIICQYNDFDSSSTSIGMLLIFAGMTLSFLLHKRNNYVWFLAGAFNIALNEYMAHTGQTKVYSKFRPLLMMVFMKFLSVRKELNELTQIGYKFDWKLLFSAITYVFHLQCIPLGGWNPYIPNISKIESRRTSAEYQRKMKNYWKNVQPKPEEQTDDHSIVKFVNVYIYSICKALAFLVASNCILHVLSILIEENVLPLFWNNPDTLPYRMASSMLNAYFVSMQFRFSHYFVCYFCQCLHAIWGYKTNLTDILAIEFPRSLVRVTSHWNMVFTEWFRTIIYAPLKQQYGDVTARLATFALSALLHGFHPPIWCTLISLSAFTWLELKLRSYLSQRLSCCTHAYPCQYYIGNRPVDNPIRLWLSTCFGLRRIRLRVRCGAGHRHTEYNSIWVNLSNFIFSSMTILHLAFFGSVFDGNDKHNTFEHVKNTWEYLNFMSFIMLVLVFNVWIVLYYGFKLLSYRESL